MSALTLRSHHLHPHLSVRSGALVIAAALTVVAGVAVADRWADDEPSVVATADVSPAEAVAAWVEASREDVFPGATGPYLGECPTDAPGFTVGLCSRLTEDLGDVQIHLVGVYATDWGADLLLERSATGWAVTGVSPWPQLGTPSFGPPWSPATAIATWWAREAVPSVTERFGDGAVHLRTCADAREVADARTGQPILCSTLATDDGARERVYVSGLVDAPPAVRITLTEEPDHTWRVTDVVDLG